MSIAEGTELWRPSPERIERSELARYMRWLAAQRGLRFDDYRALHAWSVDKLEDFWASVWDYFEVRASVPYTRVLDTRRMPGATWFAGARLNYAEHALRHASAERPAIVSRSELRPEPFETSWAALHGQVAAIAAWLRAMGVRPGDRVASYLPNLPETLAAFLACSSVGAVWSSCAPDMGGGAVLDRFRQIEPKVLFAVDGYRYGGRDFDRRAALAEVVAQLPSLERVVLLPQLDASASPEALPGPAQRLRFADVLAQGAGVPLAFEQLPFEHPLWIVYSSGTTGVPKAIVHGQGGVMLEYFKALALHKGVGRGDRYCFVSSTGWIVWNLFIGGLLPGATLVMFDGHPAWPDAGALWRFLGATRTTHFGCGAALVATWMKAGVEPTREADLSALQSISTTGSPLPVDAFEWLYTKVKRDWWVTPVSGGTDMASGIVGANPLDPVTAGEMQCKCLGVAAEAFDDAGRPVVGEVGELVITAPMPSMPLYFWGDTVDARRYRESYFEHFPGVWRHGDWIRFSERGTCVIYGRSDTTINRHGIRMGTAEIYRVVEALPEITDSLVVDLEYLGRPSRLLLFVVLRAGSTLDDALKARIADRIRRDASARHVPDEIVAVAEVPRTLTGKKMELPVRKLLLGWPADKVASADAMTNPASLGTFVAMAQGTAGR